MELSLQHTRKYKELTYNQLVSYQGIHQGTYLFWLNFMILSHIFPLAVWLTLPLARFLPDVFPLYEFLSLLAEITVVVCVRNKVKLKACGMSFPYRNAY